MHKITLTYYNVIKTLFISPLPRKNEVFHTQKSKYTKCQCNITEVLYNNIDVLKITFAALCN